MKSKSHDSHVQSLGRARRVAYYFKLGNVTHYHLLIITQETCYMIEKFSKLTIKKQHPLLIFTQECYSLFRIVIGHLTLKCLSSSLENIPHHHSGILLVTIGFPFGNSHV